MNLIKGALLALASAFALVPVACGTGGKSSGLAQSCASSGDCKDGLLCINQTCVQNTYPVLATAKECVLIECSGNADCCDPADLTYSPTECADYKTACDADAGAVECFLYDNGCVCTQECDTKTSQCVVKVPACANDNDCFGGRTCDIGTGKCVECTADSDCRTDESCTNGTCIAGCKADEECEVFETCDTKTKLCKYTGCTTDRECILYRGRADAVCKKDGTDSGVPECDVPCTENAECGAGHVCEGGSCKFLGCEKDAECVTYFKELNRLPDTDVSAKCVDIKK